MKRASPKVAVAGLNNLGNLPAYFILAAFALNAQTGTFEVASFKMEPPLKAGEIRLYSYVENPGRIAYQHVAIQNLIADAYDVYTNQISGIPRWTDSIRYALSATLPQGSTKANIREMLRNLLAEQLNLRVHMQEKQVRGYVLVQSVHGFRLKQSQADPEGPSSDGSKPRAQIDRKRGRIVGTRMSMKEIALLLSVVLEQPVVDKTSIDGFFDIQLRWTPEATNLISDPGAYPSIFGALEEQLGLRVRSQVVSARYLIVDNVERDPKSE